MTDAITWLHAALWLLPLSLLGLTWSPPFVARLRLGTLAVAVTTVIAAATLYVVARALPGLPSVAVADPGRWLGRASLRVDALAVPLFPMATLIWAGGLMIAPAASFSAGRVRRSALSVVTVLLAFSSESLAVLGAAWIASCALFVLEHRHLRSVTRVAGIYLGVSCVAWVAGATLLHLGHSAAGCALLSVAVLVRKGIVPLHSWMPHAFEHGHLVPTIAFTTPQLGS
jgi:hypothetical protein